jgi:prepilin-type N-terminal cleavage/methylation domain-containing protein
MDTTVQTKNDRGFTLVELLIVIVILGILATVTVFAVRGITDKGQQNSCKVERRAIETAFEAYFADKGTDATQLGDTRAGANATPPAPVGAASTSTGLVPGYLKTDPSARWQFVANTPPTITGQGACAGL